MWHKMGIQTFRQPHKSVKIWVVKMMSLWSCNNKALPVVLYLTEGKLRFFCNIYTYLLYAMVACLSIWSKMWVNWGSNISISGQKVPYTTMIQKAQFYNIINNRFLKQTHTYFASCNVFSSKEAFDPFASWYWHFSQLLQLSKTTPFHSVGNILRYNAMASLKLSLP